MGGIAGPPGYFRSTTWAGVIVGINVGTINGIGGGTEIFLGAITGGGGAGAGVGAGVGVVIVVGITDGV